MEIVGLKQKVDNDINKLIAKFVGIKPHPLAKLLINFSYKYADVDYDCDDRFEGSDALDIINTIEWKRTPDKFCKLCYLKKANVRQRYKITKFTKCISCWKRLNNYSENDSDSDIYIVNSIVNGAVILLMPFFTIAIAIVINY